MRQFGKLFFPSYREPAFDANKPTSSALCETHTEPCQSSRERMYKGRAMSGLGRTSPFSLLDLAWRIAFRLAFPLARLWWRVARPQHEGALVAVYVGPALLLVRSSYRNGWHLPGGGVRRGEMPEAAARRELDEEIGLATSALLPVGVACGIWDGRRDRVHFFELRLTELPKLQLDNREIIAARLTSPSELGCIVLTGPAAAYVAKSSTSGPLLRADPCR